jgi:hypothetical protein
VVRTAVAAVVGGTASAVGGGKFANGAVTSAFQHLFNQEASKAARRFGVIFYDKGIETSANQSLEGKTEKEAEVIKNNKGLWAHLQREASNANKLLGMRGLSGEVKLVPYSSLEELETLVGQYVGKDTRYATAVAHGIMRDRNDPSSWTGDVDIAGKDVSYTVWNEKFNGAVKAVGGIAFSHTINCSALGFENAYQIGDHLRFQISAERIENEARKP